MREFILNELGCPRERFTPAWYIRKWLEFCEGARSAFVIVFC